MDAIILISSNFSKAYQLLAIISASPARPLPIHYVMGKENCNLASFAAYIVELNSCCSSMAMCSS
jgi:hypothetical protein